MLINVFLSVGRTYKPEQEKFAKTIENFLMENGLQSCTVERSDFSSGKPLETILQVMRGCSGTVVVAFERLHINSGFEFPGHPNAITLKEVSLPTVWNQIEAGMAYTLSHPLLAIAESQLRGEGLLEEGYDWFVKWTDLTAQSLEHPDFLKTFMTWKSNVEAYEKSAGRHEK